MRAQRFYIFTVLLIKYLFSVCLSPKVHAECHHVCVINKSCLKLVTETAVLWSLWLFFQKNISIPSHEFCVYYLTIPLSNLPKYWHVTLQMKCIQYFNYLLEINWYYVYLYMLLQWCIEIYFTTIHNIHITFLSIISSGYKNKS